MANVFSKEQVRQIFESGAVGIDLGTTYSAVAAINNAGQVEILSNAEGALITPSVVLFDEDGTTVVGEQAKRIGQGQSHRVVECAKRLMGQKNMEYEIAGKRYSPEGISAILLGKLIKDASERLGRQVKSAVITVPAWFNDDARQATLRAGKASGLNVLGILSEPTAAALAYGVKGTKARYALVYDLGGGTFDVSVIEIFEDGRIEELARDGEVLLGGKDWDDRIVQRVREQYTMEFGEEFPVDCDEHMSLVIDAENAKKALTTKQQAKIFVQHGPNRLTITVTRNDFEEWTSALVDRTEITVDTALKVAGLKSDDINVCLPVGGSTRMPSVKEMLERKFPGKVDHTVEKDQVVAIGACLYMAKKLLEMRDALPAHELSAEQDKTNLSLLPGEVADALRRTNVIQVSSRAYGIAVSDGVSGKMRNDHFIRANQPLPLQTEKTYGTMSSNQREVELQLLEGDSESVAESTVVAKRSCSLPPGLPQGSKLDCRFIFTEEGMIRISLREPTSGNEIELQHSGAVMSQAEEVAVTAAIQALS